MQPEQLGRPSHGINCPRFHWKTTKKQIAPTMASVEVMRSFYILLSIIVYLLVWAAKPRCMYKFLDLTAIGTSPKLIEIA